jgi:hypothetical protein
VRLARAASLLREPGALAIIDTNQVESGADRGYFAASQVIYRKYEDSEPPALPGPETVVPDVFGELTESRLFEEPALLRYRWDQTYTRRDYEDLMRSYSNMRAMGIGDRENLIADLGALIDKNYGGLVTRPLVVTLVVASTAGS